jgi:LPXTG-motif cell wall-anchored protein
VLGAAALLLPGVALADPGAQVTTPPSTTAPPTSTPPPTTTPPPSPTTTLPATGMGSVTVTESCAPGTTDTFTVHNTTAAPVDVTVTNFDSPFQHFTVPAGGTHDVAVSYAGAPYGLVFTRDDTGEVLLRSRSFLCPSRIDKSYDTTAGHAVRTAALCFPAVISITRQPAHGSLRNVTTSDGIAVRYTPRAGFIGTDSFDYECGASTNTLGTVTIHVRPVTAGPPPPAAPPAGSALPNTGASHLPLLLGAGLALLAAGAGALRLGRR